MSVSATSSRATPRQATTTISHHTRNHTQRTKPPSRFARLRSWISRTKLYLGAAIGLLTLIVTSISLLPSFLGGRYGKKTLELALWTARKDYVEACQEYLNHTSVGCQQALEKGLPPPPGLDRFAARSLQILQEEVQWLKTQPVVHKPDEHMLWLRLWLQIGILMVGLIVTGQWTKLRHLLKRQLTRPSYLNRALGLDFVSRQRELRVVPEPVLLRPHSVSTATTTGINVEEGRVTRLRHRTQTLASETNTAPTPEGLAGGHLAARNRAAAPAGKQRVEKELKRRQKELKKKENEILEWSELDNSQVNESYLGGDSLSLFPSPPPVVEAVTTLYIPGNADEYKDWEISNKDAFLEASLRYDKREDFDISKCLRFESIASDVRVCD